MVTHQEGFRRMWMFPRNIRKIYPWKIAQLVSIFKQLLDSHLAWVGNTEVQKEFSDALQEAGLKRGQSQRDGNPGGSRTYEAQIESLGLIFRNESNEIHLTLAGDAIHRGDPPLPILQTQLFRYQYPSVYSQGSQVRIHPEIQVKPFHFLLKLIQNLQSMTVSEMIVPVILGHENGDLDNCTELVIRMRQIEFDVFLFQLATEEPLLLHTPKAPMDRDSGEDRIRARLKDAYDIANTFKNCLETCFLIEPETGNQGHYTLTSRGEILLAENETDFNRFIGNVENEEKFQREFGLLNRTRDNRRFGDTTPRVDAQAEFIKRLIRAEQNTNYEAFNLQDFANRCQTNFGIPSQRIVEIATLSASELFGQFEASFLELASGGQATATSFEITITRLLNERQISSTHIGNRRRSRDQRGAFADVLVELEDHCGLIDAKAYQRYPLPADDYHSVVNNYVKNFRELTNKPRLGFFAFISTEFTPSVADALVGIHRETEVPATAITATAFITLYTRFLNNDLTREQFLNYFYTGRVIRITDI